MCAQGSGRLHPAEPPAGQPGALPPGFSEALDGLVAAIGSRKVEAICAAYLALRRAAGGMKVREMFDVIGRAVGSPAEAVIVSAFSHRRCFMCEDGTAPCQTCDGTGTVDRFPCPQCHGIALEACAFCRGTGWNDGQDMPGEIRPAVRQRRASHVERDLERLSHLDVERAAAGAGSLDPDTQRNVAAWLLRFGARASDLAESLSGNGDDRVARLGAAAAEADRLLQALRPNPEPPPKNPAGGKPG